MVSPTASETVADEEQEREEQGESVQSKTKTRHMKSERRAPGFQADRLRAPEEQPEFRTAVCIEKFHQ